MSSDAASQSSERTRWGSRRGLWGTRFGFYLAAIGSAFGLGNLWRFPYVAVENGGGAFVLLYVFFALTIGLSLLICELMIGKLSRRGIVSAFYFLSDGSVTGRMPRTGARRKRYVWVGRFAVVTCLLILSYYAVISGWVLHFLTQFFFSHLRSGGFNAEASLGVLRDSGWLQLALASVHLLITVVIVAKGVQEGMEKWVGNAMPVFIVLLMILVTRSLSLPTSANALRFFFYPDFSKLTAFSPLQALGHVFFTLSIGFGTLVTFGSYLNEGTHIAPVGFRVTALDTVISLFAGLLIFPLIMFGDNRAAGPELLFQALPRLLSGLDNGFLFGMAFFICLYLAALGASIGILESLVANVLDFTSLDRVRATWITGGIACLFAALPAFATSVFKSVHFGRFGFLEILDAVLIDGLLPLAVLGIVIGFVSGARRERIEAEFVNDGSLGTRGLYSHWLFTIRWLAPGVIIFAFALAAWGLIRR